MSCIHRPRARAVESVEVMAVSSSLLQPAQVFSHARRTILLQNREAATGRFG
jgi:hypothetical protein